MDIHDLLHRFTLESISRIAFGISLGCITNPEVNFAKDFDYCTNCVNDSFLNPMWLLERYFTPKGWKYFFCLFRINRYAKQIITERRNEVAAGKGLNKNDLLTLYLDKDSFKDIFSSSSVSSDDTGTSTEKKEHLDTFMEPNDKNLRDVILNMVIAGRDTTAQALSWAFFCFCRYSAVQKKLRDEASRVYRESSSSQGEGKSELDVLSSNDGLGSVSFETLQHLKYTEAFCMEVLRLYPSVPKEAKEVSKDDILPDGTPIYVGDLAGFIPYAMGRDKDLWGEDAEEFHPERFLDLPAKHSPFKFIAFQVGNMLLVVLFSSSSLFLSFRLGLELVLDKTSLY
jgi:cytochrome P450